MIKKHKIKTISFAFIFIIIMTGCNAQNQTEEVYSISIAEQYGLAYAPLQIIKEKKLMKKHLPDIQVNWKQLGNTATIREAMLAGEVDAGFMAIPPFLVGWDKGMKWKIASGLSYNPVGLVTYNKDIQSIKDFDEKDRIALPQPGSVQHILLSMACEKIFGKADKLDHLIVTLAHPDGMNALLAQKEITAHFTAPPYLFKELKTDGMHQILDGKEAMGGDFTFIVGVTTEEFHDTNPEIYEAFIRSLHEAIDIVQNQPQEAAAILSPIYDIPQAELFEYLTWPGTSYNPKVKGVEEFAAFMEKHGYISKKPNAVAEILWEDVQYEK